jgi:hypothetical protein
MLGEFPIPDDTARRFYSREDSLRRLASIALVLGAALGLWTAPALAFERLVQPAGEPSVVVRVADLDRSTYTRTHRELASGRWSWRYRAAYTRWLHNEYVVAGYPVNQYRAPTYYWVEPCCYRHAYRHW